MVDAKESKSRASKLWGNTIQVRILSWLQILGVINLRLRGSKLSIGYGVMEHRETEYERGYGNLPQRGLSRKRQKWDSGLWFESILVN